MRKKIELTIRDLSKKSNVATGYISKLENDNADITNPTKDVMEKISSALNKTVPEVFF